ncbi:hypothetical protein BACINT_00843 [Bacteroides intestinalis DSM 17393]|uniref:Uncharacterized protein n=1 Tax=Bacteroides intestinalis DSM 17393 TaxID=471870 RepID=B3C7F3_9BACE|nr:hypothetical protein BACINT_00843 [Bacteroides intestinalis DSM 17393]
MNNAFLYFSPPFHTLPLSIYLHQQWKGIFILSIKHISVFIRKFASQ